MTAAASGGPEIVLVSNGPGELYTWALPVLREVRRQAPGARVVVSLIPCQFASGHEADIARTFDADAVTTPVETMRALAAPGGGRPFRRPSGGASGGGATGGAGAVIALGGNASYAARLGGRLGYRAFRYGFEPLWNRRFDRVFVPDAKTAEASVRRGAPHARVEVVGNLVADAVDAVEPIRDPGSPHVMVVPGSRAIFARPLIPFLLEVVDRLAPRYPQARFVWPVSRLLPDEAIEAGIAGRERRHLGGIEGVRSGAVIHTPAGATLEMIREEERHAHMHAADLAVTIPGTNTLELGIVGVPALVILPMNRPELIPLEGLGHWLGLIPGIGRYLKRYAVKLYVEGLDRPVSLPNRISGDRIYPEMAGMLTPRQVADAAAALLDDRSERDRIRDRLAATMPRPGAAAALVARVLEGVTSDADGIRGAAARSAPRRGSSAAGPPASDP